MSMDKSLISRGKLGRHRSVLTRTERIDRLVEEDRWQEGRSVFGLPKVRTLVMRRAKAAKEEEAPKTEGEAEEAPTQGDAQWPGA